MAFINHTNFPAVTFDSLDRESREHHVVVATGSYSITDDGNVSFAMEQEPPLAAAQLFSSTNPSSLRRESDFAPFKPACDIVLYLKYIRPDLVTCLRTKHFARFARGYNGPDYGMNHYHEKLHKAYSQWKARQ